MWIKPAYFFQMLTKKEGHGALDKRWPMSGGAFSLRGTRGLRQQATAEISLAVILIAKSSVLALNSAEGS